MDPLMHSFRHQVIPCRVCGSPNDGAFDPRTGKYKAPPDGSFSVCVGCGEVSVFVVDAEGNRSMREPNFTELMTFNNQFADIARELAGLRARRAASSE